MEKVKEGNVLKMKREYSEFELLGKWPNAVGNAVKENKRKF